MLKSASVPVGDTEEGQNNQSTKLTNILQSGKFWPFLHLLVTLHVIHRPCGRVKTLCDNLIGNSFILTC